MCVSHNERNEIFVGVTLMDLFVLLVETMLFSEELGEGNSILTGDLTSGECCIGDRDCALER